MHKSFFFLSFLMIFSFGSFAQQKHPNLILTQEGVQQIKTALGKYPLLDKTFKEAKNAVDADIRQGIDVPIPKDPGGGYTHEKHKLNYQNMLNAGIIWQVTGNKKYAEYLKSMFLAYAKIYPSLGVHPEGKNSSSPGVLFWQSLNDAVWLVHIAQAYDCIYTYLNAEERSNVENNLLRKAVKYMTENDAETFNRIHNHGTWSVTGVAMTGYTIGDKDMVEKALYGKMKDKKTGFFAQISQLFSPDGYYTEGAYYQRYAIMPFMLLAKTISNNQPELKIFDYNNRTLTKATATLLQFTDTHGAFLPFNDALKDKTWESGELVYAVDISYGSLHGDASLLYVANQQQRVMLSEDGVKVAKDIAAGKTPKTFQWRSIAVSDGAKGDKGGVCIMRSSDEKDQMSVLMKYSSYGMDHGHFDKLSMMLYDQNREIFTDYGSARFLNIEQKRGGRYLPENKTWAKQTIAHNTVTVDGKSNYGGNTTIADKSSSITHFVDLKNPAFQMVSAKDSTAYPGVNMQRTMALVQPEGFTKPFVIDVFQLASEEKHQYDMSYYYSGSLIETNVNYQAAKEMKPFGKNAGYQHLWVKAQGNTTGENSLFTFFNENRFYSILTTTIPGSEVYFTEIGATDPELSLRTESGITIRLKNTNNFVFSSVIEPHGSFSSITEASVGSYGSFAKIETLACNSDGTVILLTDKKGVQWIFMFTNNNTSSIANHKITVGSDVYSWTGCYQFEKRK